MPFRRTKTTPRVVDGKVQRKNRSAATPSYWNTPQRVPVIDRERPGPEHRHLLRKADIVKFITLLPDWDELSQGLDAIVLATCEENVDGWHVPGIVGVCAWERTLWRVMSSDYYQDHKTLFERLNVQCERRGEHWLGKFTEDSARAYQLLHILLHEMGHHHDRMTTRSRRNAARGESYAEQYALRFSDLIWDRFTRAFAL